MKIVLFGIGKIYEEIKSQIDFHSVVGIVDNEYTKLYQEINGISVVQPERINEYEYDYVVICNNGYFEAMRGQLISLGVPPAKIVGWQYYLYILKYGVNVLSRNEYDVICDILCKLKIQSVLDMENCIEKNAFFVGNTRLTERVKDVRIYSSEEKFNPNIYCGSTKEVEAVDVVLFLDFFLKHSISEFISRIEQVKNRAQYIVVSVPYPACDEWRGWSEVDFRQFGEVTLIKGKILKYFVVKLPPGNCDQNSKMYVVSHKKFMIPQDPFYTPIYVGGYEPEYTGALRDSDGDNISQLNKKINELTAFYWVWKNTRSEQVGFCHYRRFLGNNLQFSNSYFGVLTRGQAESYLNDVDMLTARAICTYPRNISKQLKDTINDKVYENCYRMYEDRIKEICPEYLEDFYFVMNGIVMYPCNMFYTRWEVFDRYCRWVFPIVAYVADKLDIRGYDSYSERTVGFFAERMLTVWILHNHIKVAEMEVVSILD